MGRDSETMYTLGKSPFGSTFLRIDEIKNQPDKKRSDVFTFRKTNVNWNPKYFKDRIRLIERLLGNIANMVRVFYGEKNNDLAYWICDDDEQMREYLLNRSGVFKFDMDRSVDRGQISDNVYSCDYDKYYEEKIRFVEETTK